MPLSADALANRAAWDRESKDYQERHGHQLGGTAFVWGVWSIPESRLNVLGDVRGKRVLELGCGAAQSSVAMAKMGADVTALDNSAIQLDHARRHMARHGYDFPLIHGTADRVPLADGSFDLVFCDHGAMTFSETGPTLREVNRLLVAGGELVFNIQSPLHEICYDTETAKTGDRLAQDYFTLGRIDETAAGGMIYYQHTYGEWIGLFTANGFAIVSLTELQPPANASSTYDYAPLAWARRWPAENIWKVRKIAAPATPP